MSCCTDWPTERDPVLHDHLTRKLLIPGWAGQVTDTEAAYIARELTRSPMLRRTWRVAEFTRQRRAITPPIAKRLARWWANDCNGGVEASSSDTDEKCSDAWPCGTLPQPGTIDGQPRETNESLPNGGNLTVSAPTTVTLQ